jgi:hypothetical protein
MLSGLITRASRRPQGDDYRLRANRTRAARARKCMRRETVIEPSTGSTPEFWRTERPWQVRPTMAIEQRDRSCPRRSSSPRNCVRRCPHPCARAGVIAGKHSARVPREIPRKRKLQQMRAHDFLNGQIVSWRCEFLTVTRFAQEFSARSILRTANRRLLSLRWCSSRTRRDD